MYRLVLAVLMTVVAMVSTTYMVYTEVPYPDDPDWLRFIAGWLMGAFAGGMVGALVMRAEDRMVASATGVLLVIVGIPCTLAAGIPACASALTLSTTFRLVGLGQRAMVLMAGIGVRS